MKKVLSMVALSALMLAGCQEDLDTLQNGNGEESVVRITLQAPEAMGMTRAAGYTNSAKGGITNVDWAKYDLRYQIAVYDKDGTNQVVAPIVQIVPDASTSSATTFEVRLVNNREYKFVAWADFVNGGSTTDLHYDTSDLKNITCKDDEDEQVNNESRDAYFVTENQTVNAEEGVSLTLRRPFAKVRVVTTDWDKNGVYMPDNFKITYYNCQRFNGLNAVTGVATGSNLDETITSSTPVYTATFDSKTEKDYSEGYEAESDKNRTLTVDYLLATPSQSTIHFKLETLDGKNPVSSYDFTTNIPIQRNFLTTILGNFLTENTKISVQCDENFEEEINAPSIDEITGVEPNREGNTYFIESAANLVWISEKAQKGQMTTNFPEVKGGYTLQLVNDIDMAGIDWKPIYWKPTDNDGNSHGIFDGDGHTIRNLTIDSNGESSQGFFSQAVIDIKDLTLENVTINNETGYAGAIAGDLYGSIENCHVKHVFIRATKYYTDEHYATSCTGGMIGIHSSGDMKKCTAEDVNVKGFKSVGGLSGRIVNNWAKDAAAERKYENCSVSNATLWITSNEKSTDSNANTPLMTHVGALVGAIYETGEVGTVTFSNCTQSACEYKVGLYDKAKDVPVDIFVTGEEGDNEKMGPQYTLFGNINYADKIQVTVTDTETKTAPKE